MAHVVADLGETIRLHLLTTKHQHLAVPTQHLLGRGGDIPHRLLDLAAQTAEATTDDGQ